MEKLFTWLKLEPHHVLDHKFLLTIIIGICCLGYALIYLVKYIIYKTKIKNLEIIMAKFPNYADVRYKIAEIYYNHKDYDNAIRYYKEALEIYPYNQLIKIKLAILLIEHKKDINSAFKLFAEIRFAPDCSLQSKNFIDKYLKNNNFYEQFYNEFSNKCT